MPLAVIDLRNRVPFNVYHGVRHFFNVDPGVYRCWKIDRKRETRRTLIADASLKLQCNHTLPHNIPYDLFVTTGACAEKAGLFNTTFLVLHFLCI